MGLLKTRKNKKFDYSPRYYKGENEGSPFQIKQKFDAFRTTTGDNRGLKKKFRIAWQELRSSSIRKTNRTIVLIAAILILLFLYIIDFDLSIFKQPL